MQGCPFCGNEKTASYRVGWHIWTQHILKPKGKIGVIIASFILLLSLLANIIQIYQGVFSGDSERLKRVEQVVVYCSLKTDYLNATQCLTQKGISLQDIRDYIELHKNDVNKKYITGLGYLINGNYDSAIAYISMSVEDNPLNYKAYGDLAWLYYQKGNYNKSIEYGLRCLDYDSSNIWCASGLALSYGSAGQYESSKNIYEQLLPNFEANYAQTANNLAFIYLKNGECSKSLEFYHKIENITPNACVYHNIGLSYALLGKQDQAQAYYKKAEATDPNYYFKCFPNRKNKALIINQSCNETTCEPIIEFTPSENFTANSIAELLKEMGVPPVGVCK